MLKLRWATAIINSIWAVWFRAKYFKVSSIWFLGSPIGGSCIWRRLSSLSPFLQQGNNWVVGNGLSISLQYNHWIDNQSVSSRFPYIQFSPMDRVNVIIHNNSWSIPQNLPDDLKDFLLHSTNDIMVANSSSPDSLYWMGSSSGILTLKAAWHLLRTRANCLPQTVLIWNKYANPRLFFPGVFFTRKLLLTQWQKIGAALWLQDVTAAISVKNLITTFSSPGNLQTPFGLGFLLLVGFSTQALPPLLQFGK